MSIAIFYDSHCGLCARSARMLKWLDWLKRIRLVDLHDAEERQCFAPDLSLEDLNRTMHIRLPDGRTFAGFSAFRELAWHLPLLWPIAPLLYLPGVRPIGDVIYARIAQRRRSCTHESC